MDKAETAPTPIGKDSHLYASGEPILGLGMMGGRNWNILRMKTGDIFGKPDGDEVWFYMNREHLMDLRDAIEEHLGRDTPRGKNWPKGFATEWTI